VPGVVVADLNTGTHANLNALLVAADGRISALQNYSANHNLAQVKVDALLNAMQGMDYNAILAARNALQTASRASGVVVADLNTGIHADLNALLAAADERISALQTHSANHNLAQIKVDALLNAMQGMDYNAILAARNALRTASQASGVVIADLNTGIHADLNALLAAADERISALQTHSANHNLAQIKVDALLNAMQGTDYNVILTARNALHTASQAPGVVVADLNTGIHADLNALLAAADERISALQNYSANHNTAQIKVDALLAAMQGTDYNVILAARNALQTASQAPGVVVADLNTGIHADLNALLAAADERISALQNYSANHNLAQIKVDALLNTMQGTDYIQCHLDRT